MQLRILNSCKNRVKHYTNKKKGQEAFKQHKKDSGRIREMRLGRVGSCRHLRGRIALQAKLSLLPAMGAVIFNYDTASLGYPGETRTGNICRRSGNRCGVGGGCRLRVGKRGSKRAEAIKTAFSGFLPPRVITFWNFQTWAKHKKAYFCTGQADKRLHSPKPRLPYGRFPQTSFTTEQQAPDKDGQDASTAHPSLPRRTLSD